jgi:hypothetical protein
MSKEKPVEAPKYKAVIKIQGNLSTIYRPGLPFIHDKVDSAIHWLKKEGYKSEEINVIGEKPSLWNEIFSDF